MTPQQIDAMKLALEALEVDAYVYNGEKSWKAITALKEALAEHAMREAQRLGQEIEPDDIASILACRDMLDAQPVPPRTWVGSGDLEDSNAYLTPPRRKPLTKEQIEPIAIDVLGYGALLKEDMELFTEAVRAVEAAHDIKENT